MTLSAVAKLAGVSAMTVSRVVNGDPRVAPDTAKRVRSAMRRIGYRPPLPEKDGRRRRGRAHQGLHTGRAAVLFPSVDLASLCTSLSVRWLRGLDRPLVGSGLQLILTRLPAPRTLPNWIDRRHIDGMIVRAAPEADWLAATVPEVPLVWVFDPGPACAVGDVVVPDDDAIGVEVAKRIAAMGHRTAVLLDNVPDNLGHRGRCEAILREAAGSFTARHVPIAPDLDQAGMNAVLAANRDAETVFLPGTGQVVALAVRAVAALPASKRPRLIACCHDRNLLASFPIPIANVDIRPEALGDAAGQQLLTRIADPSAPRVRIRLPGLLEDGPFPLPDDVG